MNIVVDDNIDIKNNIEIKSVNNILLEYQHNFDEGFDIIDEYNKLLDSPIKRKYHIKCNIYSSEYNLSESLSNMQDAVKAIKNNVAEFKYYDINQVKERLNSFLDILDQDIHIVRTNNPIQDLYYNIELFNQSNENIQLKEDMKLIQQELLEAYPMELQNSQEMVNKYIMDSKSMQYQMQQEELLNLIPHVNKELEDRNKDIKNNLYEEIKSYAKDNLNLDEKEVLNDIMHGFLADKLDIHIPDTNKRLYEYKQEFKNTLQKNLNKASEDKHIADKFGKVTKNMHEVINNDLNEQEDELTRKKRERRERRINKAIEKELANQNSMADNKELSNQNSMADNKELSNQNSMADNKELVKDDKEMAQENKELVKDDKEMAQDNKLVKNSNQNDKNIEHIAKQTFILKNIKQVLENAKKSPISHIKNIKKPSNNKNQSNMR